MSLGIPHDIVSKTNKSSRYKNTSDRKIEENLTFPLRLQQFHEV
jgi:hypothetical protein